MREMKDSKVYWLGSIPLSWKVLRGKAILTILERPVCDDDGVITCFRDGEVTLRSKRREDGFTLSDKEIGYQGIEPGDLVVHGMDGFAGAIGISDSRGKATPVLNVMDSKQNKRYLMYYLRTMAYNGVFLSLSTGIRVRSCDTNWNKLKNIMYPVPPNEEQQRIVDFLDYKCACIGKTLEKTKAAIKEFRKLRQAIITEAVTKGIRGERLLKNSGIEWIGDIPEEWTRVKIGQLFDYIGGNAFDSNSFDTEGYGQVLRIGNIKNDTIELNSSPVYISKESAHSAEKVRVLDGYILFTMTGTKGKGDYFFTVCVSSNDIKDKPLYINQRVGAFSAKTGVFSKYYNYLFKVEKIRSRIFLYETGTANQGNIGIESINRVLVQVPPFDEQKEISSYLDQKCFEIDSLIEKKEKLLTELESYKRSLIYEYVTGKKEVSI